MLRIDAKSSRELQAVILGMRQADKTIAKEARGRTKTLVQTEWKKGLAQQAQTRLEHRVLVDTARTSVSNQNVKLRSASVGRKLSGGLLPKESYPAVEFGAGPQRASYTVVNRKGTRFAVRNRHTTKQLRPANRKGYVVYPTLAGIVPRIASLWVQTIVRTFAEAAEGKR